MSDDEPKDPPAPSPLGLPMGRNLLADHLLLQGMLQHTLEENEQLRAQTEPLIKQAIDRYERLHKLDRKVTLKQICAEMGVNYGSARVLKSRYAKQKRKRKKS